MEKIQLAICYYLDTSTNYRQPYLVENNFLANFVAQTQDHLVY